MGPAGSMAALLLESYGMRVLCIDKEKDIYEKDLDDAKNSKDNAAKEVEEKKKLCSSCT